MKQRLLAEIEALLFISGEEGMELSQLAKTMRQDVGDIQEALERLGKLYEGNVHSALHILKVGARVVLTTKRELSHLLEEVARTPQAGLLSKAALETLSIIAYKQPIARAQIDEIRGVSSSGAVQKLQSRQLIEEKGRMETPGRPILYGTTEYFLNYFGLKSVSELPDIQAMEANFTETEVDLFSVEAEGFLESSD